MNLLHMKKMPKLEKEDPKKLLDGCCRTVECFLVQHVYILFWSNDTVLSTFTKNAIKNFVIGFGVLILILNYLPKVWFLDKRQL